MKKISTIKRYLELFIGLSLLPTMFGFIVAVLNDSNTASITGASVVVPLVGVFIALGLVYDSVKHIRD